ncbi:uncharacterized protein H6S33_009792 [Morchella sextelata]|uniref:uncharacterized protein n=1 Tax=Morchella sextelata TaxID=1174677 RepID=UPI001D03CE85|nr:uncharacterized protein H6S33_009792 [Morchella sextelata]KAH0602341.1 hypothetical protein H6S33_009792 [Morchella sextelata]
MATPLTTALQPEETSFITFPPPPDSPQPPAASEEPNTEDRPSGAADAVLKPSDPIPESWTTREVKGIDFNNFKGRHVTISDLITGMETIGFQGSNLARACKVVDTMRTYRSPETGKGATIFLGYTSNLISSGLRETLRYLVEHKHVSAIVTTAGGVEEDFIKCLASTYMGAFNLDGATLRKKGLNRIGNLIVPNNNYCLFEDWVVPVLDSMLEEQEADPECIWTPSKMIARLGKEINDERSVYYWAWKNDIPVFCPALTDGSLGDMLYFHTYKSSPKQLKCDIVGDIRKINSLSVRAEKVGAMILGGGIVKHHIANACLMRNGAEYAVFINTASEFDGSDAGARPDEAVSWGKIKMDGEAVKVYAEATIAFPMIVAATFARPSEPEPEIKKEDKDENSAVAFNS